MDLNPTNFAASVHRAVLSIFPCLAGLMLACCDAEKPGAIPETPAPSEWRTKEWPMSRGGKELQGRVHDLVPRNPKVVWRFRAKGAVSSEAAVANGVIVFGSDEGVIYAVDLSTRRERWQVVTKDSVEAAPAIVADRVFAGSNDKTFRAIDLTTGQELWHVDGTQKFPTGGVPVTGTNGDEWILVNGYDGVTRCLRQDDGSLLWKHDPEAFGLYLIEAMVSGVPVVQPASASFPEMMGKSGVGVLVPPGDPAALAKAWHELLQQPEQLRVMADRSRESAEKFFDERVMRDKFMQILQETI